MARLKEYTQETIQDRQTREEEQHIMTLAGDWL